MRAANWALVAAAIVLLAAGGFVVVKEPFADDVATAAPVSTGTALATVRQGPLASQVDQNGTLSYVARPDGTPYAVLNWAHGIYTAVPSAGDEIGCGQTLYQVDGDPVLLLCGGTPAYRALSVGRTGSDVRELNRNLRALGYADTSEIDARSDYFGRQTATALKKLQAAVGADQTGVLSLGAVVVLPRPLRITDPTARPGGAALPGAPLASATTTGRLVTVALDTSQQAQVKVGDPVQITLPGNRTTAGTVGRIGRVAKGSTIPVFITLHRSRDVAALDQAPVQVQITTAGVRRALIVPVTALLGRPGGGYAVERVDGHGRHHSVPVTLGLFDNADGLVQVTTSANAATVEQLSAGDHVVVPSS